MCLELSEYRDHVRVLQFLFLYAVVFALYDFCDNLLEIRICQHLLQLFVVVHRLRHLRRQLRLLWLVHLVCKMCF